MGRKYRMPINSLSSHTPSLTSCTCVVHPSYNWWANIDKWWWKFTVHLRVHLMLTVLWVLTSLIMCICPYITQKNLTAFHIPSPPSIDPFFPLGWSNHWSFYHFHSFASFFVVSFFWGVGHVMQHNRSLSPSSVGSLSHVCLFVTPWIAAYQAPLYMGFSRQEYWSGVPSPSHLQYLWT